MRRIDELFTAWPFVGLAADRSDAAGEGTCRQPQAGAAVDAQDWDCGRLARDREPRNLRRGVMRKGLRRLARDCEPRSPGRVARYLLTADAYWRDDPPGRG